MQRYNSIVRQIFAITPAAVILLLSVPVDAPAYEATLAWRDGSNPSIVGYRIYVRQGPNYQGVVPTDAGMPASGPDGVFRYQVSGVPMGPTSWFSVNGYTVEGVEARQSNELTVDYATAAVIVDTDGDGLVDADEDRDLDLAVGAGESDPNNPDSDGDGLTDGVEVEVTGTDPLVGDSDGDGYTDGQENAAGTDPNDASSNSGVVSDPVCGNGVLEGGEECDDAAANSDADVEACRLDCRWHVECGDATEDRILTATDAFEILRGAVELAACPLSNCDTDGDGDISPTDGLRVVRAAVGQQVELQCGLVVTLVLQDTVSAGRTEAVVDYTNTGSTFFGVADAVECDSLLGAGVEVSFYNDITSGALVMSLIAEQAIEGGVELANCRFFSRDTAPAPEDFGVEVVDHPGAGLGEAAPLVWLYY